MQLQLAEFTHLFSLLSGFPAYRCSDDTPMLPWRHRQGRQQHSEGGIDPDSRELQLQSPFQSGSATEPSSPRAEQRPESAGSLRHSISCPPTRNKGAAKSQPLAQGAMVRASDTAQLQLRASSHSQDADRMHSHELCEGEQAWGSALPAYPNAAAGTHNGSSMLMNGHHHQHHQHQQQQLELERRKFTRNLLSANNKKESLERYKAIMALIEACKRRLEAQVGPAAAAAVLAEAAWAAEPLMSLLQSVLDVGEALASFGNCHFPEHSNEARAILAGDYRALLKQYLSTFGFVFAQPTKQQLSHDMQEEVQCVGSLLATRCQAYDLLYDQLVRHVGLEGRGGPSTLIVNHNSASANPNTSITANPVNTTTASANSKSKALNSGIGAAAIAAAGLIGLLLIKGLRGAAGGGRRGSKRGSSSSDGQQQQQRQLRVPKGKNGRELLLVSHLSGCADELRRAKQNEEALKDDWRLGRHVRLAWPPGPPVPPGYEELAPDACNVSQLLQEMYS